MIVIRAMDDICGITAAFFNDRKWRRKSDIAKVWNRAMAELGYVVNNPEAKGS